MNAKHNALAAAFQTLAVFALLHVAAFLVLWLIAGTKIGALFLQFIFVVLPSIIAVPWLYRRLKSGRDLSRAELKAAFAKLFSFSVAGAIGLTVAVAVFSTIFLFPSWIMDPGIMILWLWFGGPLGAIAGCICFVRITRGVGSALMMRLFPNMATSTNEL